MYCVLCSTSTDEIPPPRQRFCGVAVGKTSNTITSVVRLEGGASQLVTADINVLGNSAEYYVSSLN